MIKFLTSYLILILFIISGCGGEKISDPLTSNQQEMLSYLPSETQFILYMNLAELRKTEFWKDYFLPSLTKDTLNNWLTDFEEKTGTGLKRGIIEAVTATSWDGDDLFAVRFDRNNGKVNKYFNDSGKFNSIELSGRKIYSLKDGSTARFYFAKDDLLLILKNEKYIERLIDQDYKRFNKDNPVYRIVDKIKNKNHYWMATNKGGFAAGMLNLLAGNKELPVKKIIASVNEISLSAQFTDGVDITSVWGCSDSRHAYLLSTGVRSALAMDLLAGKDYELNELMKKLEIDREDKDVYFEININKEELAGLKKLAEKKKLSHKL